MITREGRVEIMTNTANTFKYYNVGTGGDSTNPNAGNLDSPLLAAAAVKSVTPTVVGATTLEYSITVNGSDYLGQTIKEVGIFDSTGEKMLTRVNYEGFGPLSATDQVIFKITLEVD
tara:strand:+ start:2935 stop:3285 length:351 start_codon:yes stop_codon:yes gene_type:complete